MLYCTVCVACFRAIGDSSCVVPANAMISWPFQSAAVSLLRASFSAFPPRVVFNTYGLSLAWRFFWFAVSASEGLQKDSLLALPLLPFSARIRGPLHTTVSSAVDLNRSLSAFHRHVGCGGCPALTQFALVGLALGIFDGPFRLFSFAGDDCIPGSISC